jgi:hypothetical protein
MTDERLLHCSALLMVDFKDRSRRAAARWRDYVAGLAQSLKRDYERRPARGYRDEEPATGVFCAFDAGLELGRDLRERGFHLPEGHAFDDLRKDVCFQFKYAPGRSRTSDPRGTRYALTPCPLSREGERALRPIEFFQKLRREVLSWRDPQGASLFEEATEIFLIGARPLPMIEMFAGLQPHDFTDAFPGSGLNPVQPQSGNLLFVQLQQEDLAGWKSAGAHARRRAMGGMFTSRVLAPGDSYALEFQSAAEEFEPTANQVFIDSATAEDPRGLGYICRIHDGFSTRRDDPPFKVVMREGFLPDIERPEIVARFCDLREAEMAAIKFPEAGDTIRVSRGGKTIVELPLKRARTLERDGLVGEIDFDPRVLKLTVRLPFLFFPDIELPRRLLKRGLVVEWINENRHEGRHTVSFWPQSHAPSHRAQCLRALAGRLMIEARYLGGGKMRAGMDNILVYRDDFHLETAERLIEGSSEAMNRNCLGQRFNSVFTGRTPDDTDSLNAFIEMMMSMLGGSHAARPRGEGIARFVASRYSLVFREPKLESQI